MNAAVTLALALALSHPAPPVGIVVDDIGSRAFVLKSVSLDPLPDNRLMLRGWMCRRAAGASIRRLALVAEDSSGVAVWKGFVATPTFAPGRTHECRVLKINLPSKIAPQARRWRLGRP